MTRIAASISHFVLGTADVSDIDALDTVRELATHANDIKHLQDDMDKMVRDMDEIKRAIQGIEKSLSEAKGGRKVLFASLTAASMFGGAVAWVFEKLVIR